jgi:hypothetical protein
LIHAQYKEKPFAYLSHYPSKYTESEFNPTTTMIDLIDKIRKDIEVWNEFAMDETRIEIEGIQFARLVVGGGVADEVDLVREVLSLLNNDINIEQNLKNEKSKHLYRDLRFNVTILSPVTYLLPDIEEDEGKSSMTIVYLFEFTCLRNNTNLRDHSIVVKTKE